ncbi:hypothetical protein J5I95_07800 [Candidatus Poribacteria bacterium]|nr:hypothetical protein [Candidatus Poribacteria bacterium]
MQKKFWIPILIVLLAIIGCGLFYNQKTANQEPVMSIKPVGVERPPAEKPPPPGETAESGHWHGNHWHSQPHEPVSVEDVGVPLESPPSASTKYIPVERIENVEEYLRTQPPEVIYARVRDKVASLFPLHPKIAC